MAMRKIIFTLLMCLVCIAMQGQTNVVRRGGNKSSSGTTRKTTPKASNQKSTTGKTGYSGRQGKYSHSSGKKSGKSTHETEEQEQQAFENTELQKHLAKRDELMANMIANMVLIEGGQFEMGATKEQGKDAEKNEGPKHKVTVRPFAIGRYEVTQEEWEIVMGYNKSQNKGDKMPVVNVTWNEVQQFLFRLKQITGVTFRLPTEAEWEFAARGGVNSNNSKFAGSANLDAVGWFSGNCQGLQPVGLKSPNELGLYDMSGNAMEWCDDWYDDYKRGKFENPKGPSTGSTKVYRGGGWMTNDKNCRVSSRNSFDPDFGYGGLGFRLAQ